MAVSLEQFTKALVDAGLCAADEVPSLVAGCSAAGQPPNAETLARKLLADKRLTAFQAQQALAGRGLAMGEYVIVDRIGAGGMGQVFKAQHRRMKRVVALKVMSPAAMKDAAAVKRFQREVEAAARLVHPNIVTAFDAGEHRATHFLVMEFVDGGDLSALVKKQGRLPVDKAIDYTLQAARGLAFAHAEHVIHRDIKPANLLVDKKGVVKILDMGLARFDDGGEGLTGTEQVMGTVDYMSPEQAAQTKGVDARADIYSLGCTLWYLLTASKLYDGETLISRMLKHREEPIPSLMQQRDDVPWGLEQLFRRMVGKRTEDRPQSMDEVVAELEKLRGQSSGVNLAGGAETGDAALSNFLSGIGKSGGKSSSAPGASGPSLASAASTRQTTTGDEATSALSRAEIGTDPKSELHLRAAPPAAGSKQTGSGKPAAGRAAPRRPVSVPLVAGGVAASVALVALGVWIALGGWVIVRDPQGNEIARVQVPEGGTVTVVTSPPAATPSVTRPLAPRTGAGPSVSAAPPPTSTTPGVTGTAPPTAAVRSFALGPATAAARRDTGSVEMPRFVRASDPLTVEMWVRPRSAASAGESRGLWTLAGVLELKQHADHWVWQRNNRQQAPHLEQVSAPLGSAGSPVHVAAVSTGTELRLFVAGQLVGSRTLVNPLPDNAGLPQALAAWGGTSTYRPFDGTIDEVRISKVARYDKAFTPVARFEPDADTLALYHCDEGAGDVLGDASGHGHDGTIVGVAWVRADTAAIPSSPLAGAGPAASGPAFTPLFNGRDLTGWKVHPADAGNWRVENGVMVGSGPNPSHLFSDRADFQDFHLRLEARVAAGVSAGITCREPTGIPGAANRTRALGYLVKFNVDSTVDPRRTGSLYVMEPGSHQAGNTVGVSPVKAGEWFAMDVVVEGHRIQIQVNGKTTTEYVDPQRLYARGAIAPQFHNGPGAVEFRKIEIRELKPGSAPTPAKPPAYLDPAFQAWVEATQKLPAEQQLEAVSKKLMELNPGFDGKLLDAAVKLPVRISKDSVTEVGLMSDDVADLSPLRALKQLRYVSCHGATYGRAKLSDLSPLEGLPLLAISTFHTRVADLSPLARCPTLTTVRLGSTHVTAEEVARLQAALPACRIAWDGVTDSPGQNRRIAEWALQHGWTVGVLIDSRPMEVTDAAQLPSEPFWINGLAMMKTATDGDMAQVANCDGLTSLNLNNAPIGDAGLAQLKDLKALLILRLDGTRVTDAGLVHLVGHSKLTRLDLRRTRVTPAGVATLQKALPNCNIQSDDPAQPAAAPASPRAGTGPVAGGAAATPATLDLLATFDPARSLVGAADQANWQRAGTELTFTGRGQAGLVKFPYPLADRYYRLEIEFTRTAGDSGFNIDLPLKAGMFTVNLDERGRTGLARTGQATRTERIETGRRHRVAVTMAREGTADRIALEWDGRPILGWTGDRQPVVNAPWKEPASDDTQRVGFWIPPGESQFTFHRATVTWLDGVAASPPAPAATGAAAAPSGPGSAAPAASAGPTGTGAPR